YPDPGASASALQALSKLTRHDVDVKALLEQEEEIRVKMREMMKRTMETMQKAGKEYEYTIPALYV
nr:proteasome assembly chaperone family protein [Thermofilum sp.]